MEAEEDQWLVAREEVKQTIDAFGEDVFLRHKAEYQVAILFEIKEVSGMDKHS